MLAWMLYAIIASVLIGVAALSLERVLHAMRRPTRFVWIGALTLSTVWPALMLVAPRTGAIDTPIRSTVSGGVTTVGSTVALASQRALDVSGETIALAIWAFLSALFVARVIHAFRINAIRSRGWRFATVDGIRVRTSTDVGPAVVGITSMEVVLPEWVLALDKALLDIVMAHEQEHRDARDPLLLFGAAAVVCLMPWNVGLIWQARRLRSAMEVDCDARVLKRYPDTERYGLLLLAIAQRRSTASSALVATMSEPAANLSRRFAAMKNNSLSRVRLAALGAFGVAAIVAAAAIDAPAATLPSRAASSASPRTYVQTDTTMMRYIVRGFDGLPDLELQFPTQKFDDRELLQLSERLMVLYADAERRGVNAATTEGVLGIHARIERLLGGPVQVVIGGRKLAMPEREMSDQSKVTSTFERMTIERRASGSKASPRTAGTVSQERVELPKKVADPSTYFDFQVEGAAMLKAGTGAPVYPPALKNAGIAGEVIAQFVVNADGTADMGTFKVLRSTHELFTAAVREALAGAEFTPAVVGGRPVRQLLQLPFAFSFRQ